MAVGNGCVLLHVADGEEAREVLFLEGEPLVVRERSEGALTAFAYGSERHGHKIAFSAEAIARVLGCEASDVSAALEQFFREGEAYLSELMDAFDAAGESYAYAAWDGEGDAVLRAASVA